MAKLTFEPLLYRCARNYSSQAPGLQYDTRRGRGGRKLAQNKAISLLSLRQAAELGRPIAGAYVLQLVLPRARRITVGKLGRFCFPAGTYFYAGSALGGLAQRLRRYLRPIRAPRWHIDYLLRAAELRGGLAVACQARIECELARALAGLAGAQRFVPRFGASDCRCPGHLIYFSRPPAEQALRRAITAAARRGRPR